jgi:hypothetical protein
MTKFVDSKRPIIAKVTHAEVNRVLEVGRLLLVVLNDDEIDELKKYLNMTSTKQAKGNTDVT